VGFCDLVEGAPPVERTWTQSTRCRDVGFCDLVEGAPPVERTWTNPHAAAMWELSSGRGQSLIVWKELR